MSNIIIQGFGQAFIWAIIALGVYLSFRTLDFADLSIEGSLPFGGVICAILIFFKVNPYIAILGSITGGMLAGMLTGVLHTKLRIPAILSGIITMTALSSINLVVLGISYGFGQSRANLPLDANIFNQAYDLLANIYKSFGIVKADAIPITKLLISFIFMIVAYLSIYYFFGTEIGMSLRATGNNLVMARAEGIDTDWMIILGLMISNGLIALGGALFVNDMGSANESDGKGAIVIGLAAIIIGEIIFGKRRSFKVSLLSIIVGSVCFFVIKNVAIILRVQHLLNLLVAIMLIAILAMPLIKKTLSKKRGVHNA